MTAFRIVFAETIKPEQTVADVHRLIRESPELDDGERELAEALRSDPEVQRRFTEAIEKRRRIQQVLDAWYRRHGCR